MTQYRGIRRRTGFSARPEYDGRAEKPVLQGGRGALLFELLTSGVLLAIVVSTVIPMLGWIIRERHLNHQRQAALLEVGNLMERVALLGSNEMTREEGAKFELSDALQKELP